MLSHRLGNDSSRSRCKCGSTTAMHAHVMCLLKSKVHALGAGPAVLRRIWPTLAWIFAMTCRGHWATVERCGFECFTRTPTVAAATACERRLPAPTGNAVKLQGGTKISKIGGGQTPLHTHAQISRYFALSDSDGNRSHSMLTCPTPQSSPSPTKTSKRRAQSI